MRNNRKLEKVIFIAVLSLVTSFGSLQGATFSGWGYKADDGDSIMVVMNRKGIVVELAGVDCPELEQEFGEEAREFTKKMIYKKKVTVEIKTYDEQGRILGRVTVDEKDLSLALIEAGLGWYDKRDADRALAKAQKKAKKGKVGLWKTPKPTPPWVFRKTQDQKGEEETKENK